MKGLIRLARLLSMSDKLHSFSFSISFTVEFLEMKSRMPEAAKNKMGHETNVKGLRISMMDL